MFEVFTALENEKTHIKNTKIAEREAFINETKEKIRGRIQNNLRYQKMLFGNEEQILKLFLIIQNIEKFEKDFFYDCNNPIHCNDIKLIKMICEEELRDSTNDFIQFLKFLQSEPSLKKKIEFIYMMSKALAIFETRNKGTETPVICFLKNKEKMNIKKIKTQMRNRNESYFDDVFFKEIYHESKKHLTLSVKLFDKENSIGIDFFGRMDKKNMKIFFETFHILDELVSNIETMPGSKFASKIEKIKKSLRLSDRNHAKAIELKKYAENIMLTLENMKNANKYPESSSLKENIKNTQDILKHMNAFNSDQKFFVFSANKIDEDIQKFNTLIQKQKALKMPDTPTAKKYKKNMVDLEKKTIELTQDLRRWKMSEKNMICAMIESLRNEESFYYIERNLKKNTLAAYRNLINIEHYIKVYHINQEIQKAKNPEREKNKLKKKKIIKNDLIKKVSFFFPDTIEKKQTKTLSNRAKKTLEDLLNYRDDKSLIYLNDVLVLLSELGGKTENQRGSHFKISIPERDPENFSIRQPEKRYSIVLFRAHKTGYADTLAEFLIKEIQEIFSLSGITLETLQNASCSY